MKLTLFTLLAASALIPLQAQTSALEPAIAHFAKGEFTQVKRIVEEHLKKTPQASDAALANWMIQAAESIAAKDEKIVKKHKGCFYSVVTHNDRWENAKDICNSLGGHLVIFDTKEEFSVIVSDPLFLSQKHDACYWIGAVLNTPKDKSSLRWIDDSECEIDIWHKGEPSGDGVNINLWNSHGTWGINDLNGTKLFYPIIEWSKLPTEDCFTLTFLDAGSGIADPRYKNLEKHTLDAWEKIAAPQRAKLSKLNNGYKAALAKAVQTATAAGNLDEVVALKAEIDSVKENEICQHAANTEAPASLTKLVEIYDKSAGEIRASLEKEQASIQKKFVTQLATLEELLTKDVKIADAKAVRDLRTSLSKEETPLSDKKTVASNNSKLTTRETPPPAHIAEQMKIAQALPKCDIKDICKPFIKAGGSITVVADEKTITITKESEIPNKSAKYQVRSIFAEKGEKLSKNPLKQEDFDRLAHQEELVAITFSNFGISETNLRFLATCPNICELNCHGSNFTDHTFHYVKNCPNLWKINMVYSGNLTGSGLGLLVSKEKITSIDFRQCNSCDEALTHIGQMPELRYLNMQHGTVTNESIHHLAACKKLTFLDLSNNPANAIALKSLVKLPVSHLAISFSSDIPLEEQAKSIATCMPDLHTFRFPDLSHVTKEQVEALATNFPKLKSLNLHRTTITDDLVSALPGFKKLISLNIGATKLTDADIKFILEMDSLKELYIAWTEVSDLSLPLLAKMSKLGVLNVEGCTNITNAGAEAFRKKARGVSLVR